MLPATVGDQSDSRGVQQLAFDLFNNAVATDQAVTEVGKDVGFHKASIFIDMTELSRLGRQFINTALFLTDPEVEMQDKDLRLFTWLMNFKSRNVQHFKKVAREAQKSSVQVNIIDANHPEKDVWVSVPMLGSVAIHGGRIMYKVPQEIRRQLIDPDKRTYLSMRILAAFTSQYSLELYEKLSKYIDDGFSPWMSLDAFRDWIRVSGCKSYQDFRYLRRDTIEPAMAQINEFSNIRVDMETQSEKGSRKISQIRFSVQKNMTGVLSPYNVAQMSNKELYDALTLEFGLGDTEMQELMGDRTTYTDDRLWAAVAFTRHRMQGKKDITAPGKYLMKAIRENLRVPTAELVTKPEEVKKEKVVAEAKAKRQALDHVASIGAARTVDAGLDAYGTLSPEDQDALWLEFANSLVGKSTAKRLKVDFSERSARDIEAVRIAFGTYVAQKGKSRQSAIPLFTR